MPVYEDELFSFVDVVCEVELYLKLKLFNFDLQAATSCAQGVQAGVLIRDARAGVWRLGSGVCANGIPWLRLAPLAIPNSHTFQRSSPKKYGWQIWSVV